MKILFLDMNTFSFSLLDWKIENPITDTWKVKYFFLNCKDRKSLQRTECSLNKVVFQYLSFD